MVNFFDLNKKNRFVEHLTRPVNDIEIQLKELINNDQLLSLCDRNKFYLL